VVDKPKLDQMMSNLRRFVAALKALAATPRAAFLDNNDKVGSAKYHLVVAAECCIDMANHIIASENLRFPKDNADSFAALVEAGILDPDQQSSLRALARFRNRLVHLYWDVDDGRIHEYLQTSLGDFERFAQNIAAKEW
jgi:uncharacterized protein YutE (UPF0331/DUF86 family)